VLKNELREHMRNVHSSNEEDTKAVIARFFGQFLQDPLFWRSAASPPQPEDQYYHLGMQQQSFDVKQRLQERFPSCLTVSEVRAMSCYLCAISVLTSNL
jgi:hypothetical protein